MVNGRSEVIVVIPPLLALISDTLLEAIALLRVSQVPAGNHDGLQARIDAFVAAAEDLRGVLDHLDRTRHVVRVKAGGVAPEESTRTDDAAGSDDEDDLLQRMDDLLQRIALFDRRAPDWGRGGQKISAV